MLIGLGTDVCSIERLSQSLTRTPNLKERLFHENERSLSDQSLAGRFAAKEALAKAIGDPKQVVWNEIEIANDVLGKPVVQLHGQTAANVATLGANQIWLSISHDAGVAVATVVLEAK